MYNNKEFDKNSQKYGYKSANLIALNTLLNDFNKNNQTTLCVPEFQTFSHHDICEILEKGAPDWKKTWDSFVKQFNADNKGIAIESSKTITDQANKILKNLQTQILKGFGTSIPSKLKGDILMVRSTGHEDSMESANPGGNESHPAENNPNAINQAMAKVVCSYFKSKSLNQRLAANLPITTDPFMPVLIQKMVGEGLSSQVGKKITSGVMFSNQGQTTIQSAPGHGELIVNSQGPFDSFLVSKKGTIYPEKSIKRFRMRAQFDQAGHLSLTMVPNNIEKTYEFSLPKIVIDQLHQLALFLEEKYQSRMDTEFVYDGKTINIVQTRPIPKSKQATNMPSAMNPQYIEQVSCLKGSTITPDVKTAALITDPDTILIKTTIAEALNTYINSPNKGKIAAVIIKTTAPTNSHEAGEFSSLSIPVLQIADHSLLEGNQKNLVIDPQRKSIFMLSEPPPTDIIQEGLFQSPLSDSVSFFQDTGSFNHVISLSPNPAPIMAMMMKEKSKDLSEENISEELLTTLYHDIKDAKPFPFFSEAGRIAAINNKKLSSDVKVSSVADTSLEKGIEQLAIVNKTNLKPHQDIIKKSLKTLLLLRNKDLVTANLCRYTLITGKELLMIMDALENSDQDLTKDPLYSEYLDVYEKFRGLLLSGYKRGPALTNSLKQDIAQAKLVKLVNTLSSPQNFSAEQQELFLQAMKLNSYFMNQEDRKQWQNFLLKECGSDPQRIVALRELLASIVDLNIHFEWCNTTFIETYQKSPEKALEQLYKDITQLKEKKHDTNTAKALIQSLKGDPEQWQKPQLFTEANETLQKNLEKIIKIIQYNEKDSDLVKLLHCRMIHQCTDTLDDITKTLLASAFYAEKKPQQAENFKALLQSFLMILQAFSRSHNIRKKIDEIKADETSLQLSDNFNVSAALTANLGLQYCETLHDCFTYLHQLLLQKVSQKSANKAKTLSLLPVEIKNKIQAITARFELSLDQTGDDMRAGWNNFSHLSTEMSYPNLTYNYNAQLRQHSLKLKFIYNIEDKTLNYAIYGDGEEEYDRWKTSAYLIHFYLKFLIDQTTIITQTPQSRSYHFSAAFNIEKLSDPAFLIQIQMLIIINTYRASKSFDPQPYLTVFSYLALQLTKNPRLSDDIETFLGTKSPHSDERVNTAYTILKHYLLSKKDSSEQDIINLLVKYPRVCLKHNHDTVVFKNECNNTKVPTIEEMFKICTLEELVTQLESEGRYEDIKTIIIDIWNENTNFQDVKDILISLSRLNITDDFKTLLNEKVVEFGKELIPLSGNKISFTEGEINQILPLLNDYEGLNLEKTFNLIADDQSKSLLEDSRRRPNSAPK
ncbi:MAG TPA: PEP/pyruvate-binding domain-containing protein [Gammaproteobacteria bacterium]|nr:PEP/pyruvate-binding domain-containing protein [Gammaproteobacteria bacterium]